MDDSKKKGDDDKPAPDEKWVDRLKASGGAQPTGVTTYIGLLRESPADSSSYHLYRTLDMSTYLEIQKADVLHLENLTADKSPFGSLGGTRVYVRLGAQVTSIRTSMSSFSAGSGDEFDLDIQLGGRRSAAGTGGGGGPQTIPDTGCGPDCETIAPFTDPDSATCNTCAFTCQGCPNTIDTCPCITNFGGATCAPACRPLTPACETVWATCQTCPTNCATCNTCQTCQTNCGTCATQCGTCATHCGTCHTCRTRCGQETCRACTHIFTQCNQHTCGPGAGCGVTP